MMCETAGYDAIIVENVGVGQAESEDAHHGDIITLLIAPSAGDELQAIKKGIMEMANVIAVTKFDGDMVKAARRMRGEVRSATKYIDYTERPAVLCVSSVTKEGIDEIWKSIEEKVDQDPERKEARRMENKLKLLRADLINELFEVLSRKLSYDEYEKRLKNVPTLSLYELVQEIIYKDLYKILKGTQSS